MCFFYHKLSHLFDSFVLDVLTYWFHASFSCEVWCRCWHFLTYQVFFTFFDSIVLAWWDAFDMNSGKECKVMYIYCAVLVKFTEVTVITSCRSESSKKLLGHIRQDEQFHQSEAVHRHSNKLELRWAKHSQVGDYEL